MTLLSLIYDGKIQAPANKKILKSAEFTQLISIEELFEKAHQEVLQLEQETHQNAELLKKQGYEDGKQEGLALYNQHMIYLDQKVKEMEHEMQKLILPLALKAAKKIVGTELKLHPESIVDIVMQALKPVRQNYEIKIFVSKEDKEELEKEKEKLKLLFDHLRILTIEERENLTKGSCIIETEGGIINASLDNQWKALEAAFESFAKRT